jgi:hypothetical protein
MYYIFIDIHVDGARLHLRATNGLLFIPQVIYEHGEPWWIDIDRENITTDPPELSGNSTSSHLLAKQEELVKEMMTFAL